MTYRGQSNRPKNWRASRKNQMFCYERNFRLLEKMFWYYNKIKIALKEDGETRNVFLSSPSYGGGGHSKGFISDPTQRLAIRLTEEPNTVKVKNDKGELEIISKPTDWVKVVDETMQYFAENDLTVREVITRRYLLNEGSPRTCIDMEISANKYYRARDAGLQFARECAIQLGLLKAFQTKLK